MMMRISASRPPRPATATATRARTRLRSIAEISRSAVSPATSPRRAASASAAFWAFEHGAVDELVVGRVGLGGAQRGLGLDDDALEDGAPLGVLAAREEPGREQRVELGLRAARRDQPRARGVEHVVGGERDPQRAEGRAGTAAPA